MLFQNNEPRTETQVPTSDHELCLGRPVTPQEHAAAYRATAIAVRIMKPSPDEMATMLEQWAATQDAISAYKTTKCAAVCTHGRRCSWRAVVGKLCRTHYRHRQQQLEKELFAEELEVATAPGAR